MASGDALIVPIKGKAYRLYFPWWKNDGTLLASATITATSISKDGGNFATPAGSITQIQTSGGYFLDLTATEMQADCVLLKATASDTGACVISITIYTQSSGNARIPVDVQTIGYTNVATYSPAGAEALRLALSAGVIVPGASYSAGGTNVYFETTDITEATTDHFKGRSVLFVSGALLGQGTNITGYALVSGRGAFTVAQLTEAVPAGTSFIVV